MAAVPLQRGGMAAGAVNTARQLGFAFGIAALGSVFAARAAHVLGAQGVPAPGGVARALAGGQAKLLLAKAPGNVRASLDGALHAASVQGVQWAFLVSGIAGIIAAVAVLYLIRPSSLDRVGQHEPATFDADEDRPADLDEAPPRITPSASLRDADADAASTPAQMCHRASNRPATCRRRICY